MVNDLSNHQLLMSNVIITVNNKHVFEGKEFGGEKNEDWFIIRRTNQTGIWPTKYPMFAPFLSNAWSSNVKILSPSAIPTIIKAIISINKFDV